MNYLPGVSILEEGLEFRKCTVCGKKSRFYRVTDNNAVVCGKCYEKDENKKTIYPDEK